MGENNATTSTVKPGTTSGENREVKTVLKVIYLQTVIYNSQVNKVGLNAEYEVAGEYGD